MQQRLSQMEQIPLFIQTALESMTKVFDEFFLDESEQLKDKSIGAEDVDFERADVESLECYDYGELACELLSDNMTMSLSPTPSPVPEKKMDIVVDAHVAWMKAIQARELAELELIKAQKQELINKLDQSWPWKDVEKKIYR